MRLSFALILLACLAAGCVEESIEPAGPQQLSADLTSRMSQLEADYAALQPDTPQRRADCRHLVASMLYAPNTSEEHQQLADKLAAALAASDEFQMFDGSIMLLGSQEIKDHPPADRSYLQALANKIDNARSPSAPQAYRTTYSSLAVGIIVETVDYPYRVDTYDDHVNYAQWARLRDWLDENLSSLQLDGESNIYRLAGDSAATSRSNPTMDDPGR